MATRTAVLTANDRLKERFEGVLALSLIAAAVLHALAFSLWPSMTADSWSFAPPETIEVLRPDEVVIPDAPDAIVRPASPRISTDVSLDETLPVIGFQEYAELPPPPPGDAAAGSAGNAVPFTPFTVPPRLRNGQEVQRALQRVYPAALRDAGLGGTVSLLVHIDAEGRPLKGRVGESSGYEALDVAALGLVDMLRFEPALNRDKHVAVWIRLPLTFEVR